MLKLSDQCVAALRSDFASGADRYLRLIPGRLLVYRTKESPFPVNVVSLWDASASQLPHKHDCFDISTFTRKFSFRAANAAEAVRWLAALSEVRKIGMPEEQLRMFHALLHRVCAYPSP